jgi:hypothetical protein
MKKPHRLRNARASFVLKCKYVMKTIAKIGIIAASLVVSSTFSFAADIFSNTISGTSPGSSNPYTTGQSVASGLTVSGIGRGTGVTANTANDRYTGASWNTVSLDATAYFTFTLTPDVGNEIDFTNFVYTGQASGTGPTSFSFRSSVDSFATNISTPIVTGSTIVLTAPAFQNVTTPIEFRFYAWGASGSTGTFSINDFTFNGTVALASIPEPSAFALVGGLAVVGFVASRRRRSPA